MKKWILSSVLALSGAPSQAVEIVISAAGDLSFSDNHLRSDVPDVSPNSVYDRGTNYKFEDLTKHIETLFWGTDINFANVETVVAKSKRGIKSSKAGQNPSKSYAFLAHPNSIEHVIKNLNLNLFSLANNHSNDFGASGLAETQNSMERLKDQYSFVEYSGIFPMSSAIRPVEFEFLGRKIAFAAVKSPNGGGSGNLKLVPMGSNDYKTLIEAFARSTAEIKILSVHEGIEGRVVLDQGQANRYRSAVDNGGINLILAHHPHVVRPIEIYKGAAIFYSLGNFLILGAANLDNRSDNYRNYGLVGRIYFELGHGPAKITALEAIPLKGMHLRPYVPNVSTAATSIKHLNRLNASESGRYGVQFKISSRGHGVACLQPGSGARLKRLCP